MTRIILVLFFSSSFLVAIGQDEGAVVKKERIQMDKGIFVGGGISIAAGSNLGDYSTGINFEGGYMKRLNRVLSVGGSISYLSFKYDAEVTKSKPDVNGTGLSPDFYYDTQAATINDGYYLTLTGGDVSIISIAANLKFNFVPVKDNSTISVYGFAKPFIASATVSSISGLAEYYYYDVNDNWVAGPSNNGSGSYDSKTSITGGIYVGPGIEINPAKAISFYAQASFGYTFPLDIVSTRSYGNDYNIDLSNNEFPLKSLGFTSINFSAGISFNLD
jgi:hypothetical protein